MKTKDFWNENRVNICKILLFCLPMFALGVLFNHGFDENISIRIIGDEYGYWSAGAWLAGLDWSDVSSGNAYYGWGYGLILAPTLLMVKSTVMSYKIALIINYIMICCEYCIALKLIDVLDKKNIISYVYRVLISAVPCFYSYNLLFIHFTMVESLLTFLYWVIVILISKAFDSKKESYCFWAIIIAGFSLAVHLRTIGVFLITVLVGLFFLYKNKKKPINYILSVGISIAVVVITVFLKRQYNIDFRSEMNLSAARALDGNGNVDPNDFSSVFYRVKNLFSETGCKHFFISIVGKMYYLICSSFGLILGILSPICSKKISKIKAVSVYGVLCTLSELLICSLYFIFHEGRFDILIFGRYFDYTVPFLLFLSMFCFFYYDIPKKMILLSTSAIFFAAKLVFNNIDTSSGNYNKVFLNDTALSYLLINNGDNGIIIIMTITILVVLLISAFHYKNKKLLIIFLSSFLLVHWIYNFYYSYDMFYQKWGVEETASDYYLANKIKNTKLPIVFYGSNVTKVDRLQLLLGNQSVEVVPNLYERKDMEVFLITDRDEDDINNEVSSNWRCVYSSSWLYLWEKK